jgi:hypothetical protein
MPFGQARYDHLPAALVRGLFARLLRVGHTSQVRHPIQLTGKFVIMGASHAYRLKVIRHAGRTVYNANVLNGSVVPRRFVNDVPNFGESCWLEPIQTGNWNEDRREHTWRLAAQNLGRGQLFCNCLHLRRHYLLLARAGAEATGLQAANVHNRKPGTKGCRERFRFC